MSDRYSYATVGALKAGLANTQTTAAGAEAQMLRALEAASQAWSHSLGRWFFHTTATRFFEHRGPWDRRTRLKLHDDLLTASAIVIDEDGDYTFERTLTADTDYWLERETWDRPDAPYRVITLNPNSALLTVWPRGPRRIKVTGVFGYSNETEASGTLGAAITTTTGTAVTMTASHGLTGGETLTVDSEQLFVTAVSTNTLTVERGVNGSTAATHLNSAAVTRRRYPRPIEELVIFDAARTWREAQTGYTGSVGNTEFGGFGFTSTYPKMRDRALPYRVPAVA